MKFVEIIPILKKIPNAETSNANNETYAANFRCSNKPIPPMRDGIEVNANNIGAPITTKGTNAQPGARDEASFNDSNQLKYPYRLCERIIAKEDKR